MFENFRKRLVAPFVENTPRGKVIEHTPTVAIDLIEKDDRGENLTRKERRALREIRWQSEMRVEHAVNQLIATTIPWDEFEPRVNELIGGSVFRILPQDKRNSLGEKLLSKILSYEPKLRGENDRLTKDLAEVEKRSGILRASIAELENKFPQDHKQMRAELESSQRTICNLRAEIATAETSRKLLVGLCKLRGIDPEAQPPTRERNISEDTPPRGRALIRQFVKNGQPVAPEHQLRQLPIENVR